MSTAASTKGKAAMRLGGSSRGGTAFSSSVGRTRSGPAIRAGTYMKGRAEDVLKFQEQEAKRLQEEEIEEPDYYGWMEPIRTLFPVHMVRSPSRASSAEAPAVQSLSRLQSSEAQDKTVQLERDWETARLKV